MRRYLSRKFLLTIAAMAIVVHAIDKGALSGWALASVLAALAGVHAAGQIMDDRLNGNGKKEE